MFIIVIYVHHMYSTNALSLNIYDKNVQRLLSLTAVNFISSASHRMLYPDYLSSEHCWITRLAQMSLHSEIMCRPTIIIF